MGIKYACRGLRMNSRSIFAVEITGADKFFSELRRIAEAEQPYGVLLRDASVDGHPVAGKWDVVEEKWENELRNMRLAMCGT